MTPCHNTCIPNIFEIFAKFFLLVTHYLLSKSPYVCSFGVAWSIHESIGSYAQGLWLFDTVDLVVCSCSVPAAAVCLPSGLLSVLLSGSILVLDPWLPWLVTVVEQYVVGNKLGLLLGDREGGITVLVYCSICSCPKI